MPEEQTIQEELIARFPFLKDKVRIARARRLFVEVPSQNITEVFEHAVKQMKFVVLCTITGLDLGAELGVIYHVARENGIVLNLKTSVPKENPVIRTVTGHFPAAELYEREMVDLLGMQVKGLQEGKRYPLPDDWPANQYPLRKDWKQEGARVSPGEPTPAEEGKV